MRYDNQFHQNMAGNGGLQNNKFGHHNDPHTEYKKQDKQDLVEQYREQQQQPGGKQMTMSDLAKKL